ncbi:MAG: metallophosphoesterase, partial [Verrucomicrobiota bacterium]
ILAEEPELLLIGGDLTRDGFVHRWELEDMKAELDGMNIPYHVIPGNMDAGNKHTKVQGCFYPERDDLEICITPESLAQFESVFGPSNWSIIHKNLRVSGFCDMLLNSGLPEEEQLWKWLEAQKDQPRADHHIWMMHYALFVDRPDEGNFDIKNPDEYYEWYFSISEPGKSRMMEVFKATDAERVLTGHIHCRKDHSVEGIHFDLAPGIALRQWGDKWPDGDDTLGFYRFDVDGAEMTKTFIPLEKESTTPGAYGKGGHTPENQRDYSLAREEGGEPK